MSLSINHISIRTLQLEATRCFYVDAVARATRCVNTAPAPPRWHRSTCKETPAL